MKRLILIAVLGLMVSTGAFAQKVYKEGDKVILDLSVAAGMPAGAVDDTPKKWVGDPSNGGGPMANNLDDGSLNLKVYPKLEIAPYDMKSNGDIDDVTTGTFGMNWATAFDGCKKSTSLGGDWRLPTQRELMYMWIFKSAFDDLVSPTFFGSAHYWSATELPATRSWGVNFYNGPTYTYTKADGNRVRCVREVTP